jgi:hypothetical protein
MGSLAIRAGEAGSRHEEPLVIGKDKDGKLCGTLSRDGGDARLAEARFDDWLSQAGVSTP